MPTPVRIVRVVRVEDTREWEEGPDERWHPIPGSGRAHECARCGKDHEVHAEVELSDGSHVIVGTGCAKADSLAIATQIKGLDAKAKRLARMQAELASQKRKLAAYREVQRRVAEMKPPPIERGEHLLPSGKTVPMMRMGDVSFWMQFGEYDSPRELADRKRGLLALWIARREREAGFSFPPRVDETLARKIAGLERERGQ